MTSVTYTLSFLTTVTELKYFIYLFAVLKLNLPAFLSMFSFFFFFNRSKRENVKTGVKPDAPDQEPEGLTLLVPDIQRTAEIVHAATTSLRQANQGQ